MFQLVMAGIFREHIGEDIAGYLDELVVYALRFPLILPVFDRTLGQLVDAGFKCKPHKCQIFPASIHYL